MAIFQIFSSKYCLFLNKFTLHKVLFLILDRLPGDYCEEVIPDPIPNSEVKLFSADGTLP